MSSPLPIPFPISTAPGGSPQESGGRLINCSAEPLGEAHGAKVVWRRRPGSSVFTDLALSSFRGGIVVGNLAFIAVGTNIVTVTSAGLVSTLSGTIPGTDRVQFARDNESPTPSIQAVSPANGAFSVSVAGGINTFNGGGVLPASNTVAAQDGYFFWGSGDNRVFAAGPNSTTVNALTFITVQSRATGSLLRVVPYQGLMYFFAQNFCEIWSDTAQPFPAFPYSRYAVLDRGLYGRNAIAGWEDGFGQMCWVGDDARVYTMNGSAPEPISTPDLDRLIQAVGQANADTLQASCYVASGKRFWALSSPSWTWEVNLNTGRWNERESWNAGQYGAWRSVGSLLAFGKWLTGDSQSTKLLFIDPTSHQESGNPMLMRLESAPVMNFPYRSTIARADFNFVTGVGIETGTTANALAPQVGVSCSRNGGITWDGPRLRQLGAEANSIQRVYATRFGQSTNQGPRFRLDISDPVYSAFMNGTCSTDIRAS